MTNRDVALLAFRLLGLWLVANAAIGVAGIPYYWEPQFKEVRSFTIFATLLPVLVAIGIGVPVWFSADWFAERIFPGKTGEATRLDRLRGDRLFALALSVLGVLFVCEGVPPLVNGVALFVQSRRLGSTVFGPDLDQRSLIWSAAAKAQLTAGVARLLIGLGLLAGPLTLTAAATRVRKELTGTLEDEESDQRTQVAVEQADGADGGTSLDKVDTSG